MTAEPDPDVDPTLPRDADGNVDWVMVGSIESFPASDTPTYPESATRLPRATAVGR